MRQKLLFECDLVKSVVPTAIVCTACYTFDA